VHTFSSRGDGEEDREMRYTLTVWCSTGARRKEYEYLPDAYAACAIVMAGGANMAQVRREDTGAIIHSRYARPLDCGRAELEAAEREWARGGGR
jgi:hypothetical protein